MSISSITQPIAPNWSNLNVQSINAKSITGATIIFSDIIAPTINVDYINPDKTTNVVISASGQVGIQTNDTTPGFLGVDNILPYLQNHINVGNMVFASGSDSLKGGVIDDCAIGPNIPSTGVFTTVTSPTVNVDFINHDNNSNILISSPVNNNAQPAFFAVLSSSVVGLNASTINPIIFNNIVKQQGTGYNSSTGVFTASVAGFYIFSVAAQIIPGGSTSFSQFNLNLINTSGTNMTIWSNSTSSGTYYASTILSMNNTILRYMNVNDSVSFSTYGAGTGTYILSGSATQYPTYLCGALLC